VSGRNPHESCVRRFEVGESTSDQGSERIGRRRAVIVEDVAVVL